MKRGDLTRNVTSHKSSDDLTDLTFHDVHREVAVSQTGSLFGHEDFKNVITLRRYLNTSKGGGLNITGLSTNDLSTVSGSLNRGEL